MKLKYIDEFLKIAKSENKKCSLTEDHESYTITVTAKTITGVEHTLIIKQFFDGVVSITGTPIPFIPQNKRTAVLRAINKYHCEYRYYRFYIDESGSLCSSYDTIVYINDAGFSEILMGAVDAYIIICQEILVDILSIAFHA